MFNSSTCSLSKSATRPVDGAWDSTCAITPDIARHWVAVIAWFIQQLEEDEADGVFAAQADHAARRLQSLQAILATWQRAVHVAETAAGVV